jgi:hypothetical protein
MLILLVSTVASVPDDATLGRRFASTSAGKSAPTPLVRTGIGNKRVTEPNS